MVRGRLSVYACLVVLAVGGNGKLAVEDTDNDTGESGDLGLDDSSERIGPAVTQVYRHPYAASLLKDDAYICSGVILNNHWLLTLTKCFDSDVISSYITTKNLGNFSIRVGSTYNNKGGSLYKIKQLLNNFDMKVSAVKLTTPLEFGSRVSAVRLPSSEEDVTLGQLVSMVAWTPNGHMRVVNAPAMEPSICETYTRLVPGHYICIAGVQDPDRHFCRRDNGGAVIQNNTLLGVTSFIYSCGVYTKSHAFPKVPAIARWLDGNIWDENNRPTVPTTAATTITTQGPTNSTEDPESTREYNEPNRFNMFTLPFEPINLPLEPSSGDNSVIPRMSLYESYLSNLARKRTSTTPDPNVVLLGPQQEARKKAWLRKLNNAVMMMPAPEYAAKKYGTNYDYDTN